MDANSEAVSRRATQGPLLVGLGALQFILSVVIVVIASTGNLQLLPGGGIIDVSLVVTLVVTVALLMRASENRIAPKALAISYSIATYLIGAELLAMWIYRSHLDMNILLPGLTWRTVLFLYGLPYALTALTSRGRDG